MIIYLRLQFEKRKDKYSEKKISFMNGLSLDDINGQSLVSHFAVFLILAMSVVSSGVFISILNKTDGSQLGSYPYNVMIYSRLLNAPISCILILGLFHLKKNYTKVFVDEFIAIYF